jgi:glycosyltransferase involved in cell wall biosynthesis
LRRLLGYVTYLVGSTARLATMPRQDVIVAMTTPPYVVVVALLHRLLHRRTRVVLWSMDCYPDAAERFGALPVGGTAARILRAVNRWAFRRVDHVVALDGAMADLLAAYASGPDRPPISVIPNWERADLFPAEMFHAGAGRGAGPEAGPESRSGSWPGPWPGQDGRAVVVYLGNTGVGHRFDTVLEAAAELADEADFVFVGGGARWRDLTERVAAQRLGNVVLQGYVPKEATPGIMAGATAALITLDDRALGVMSPSKMHANLAAGLPVLYVGPPGSNVDEAIAAHGCGISLRNGDVAGLIEAVRALRDPGRWAQLSRAARLAFETDHNDRVALARFDAVLDGMGPPLNRR